MFVQYEEKNLFFMWTTRSRVHVSISEATVTYKNCQILEYLLGGKNGHNQSILLFSFLFEKVPLFLQLSPAELLVFYECPLVYYTPATYGTLVS